MSKRLFLSLVLTISSICVNAFTGPMHCKSCIPGEHRHYFTYTYKQTKNDGTYDDKDRVEKVSRKNVREETCANILLTLLKKRHKNLNENEQKEIESLARSYEILKCFEFEDNKVNADDIKAYQDELEQANKDKRDQAK